MLKKNEEKKKNLQNIYRILLIFYTCACTCIVEKFRGGEESIGRESNYVLLKLNVIDIMHSYFRVIRAVQPRSDSPQYTLLLLLLFYSLPFREKSQARVLPLVFKLIFVRIKPHLSSLPFFFFFPPSSSLRSSPSFFLFLVESVLIPNAAVVKVTESGAMITMDGWMEPRVWRFSYKNRSKKKKKWNEMFLCGFGFPSDQCGNVCLFNEESIALLFHHA